MRFITLRAMLAVALREQRGSMVGCRMQAYRTADWIDAAQSREHVPGGCTHMRRIGNPVSRQAVRPPA